MDKHKLTDNALLGALAQGTGAVVSVGFGAIMTTMGAPQSFLVTSLIRGATMGVMNSCYDDMIHKQLSSRESQRVQTVNEFAVKTFFECAERDGVLPMSLQLDEGQLKYAYEVAENLIMTAIRQSEQTKVEVLGRYYGSQFYKGNCDWQDMHQMITMAGSLTLRQLIMIRLIATDFDGLDTNMFIGNPSACVEINRLKDYGIWQTEGAAFGINESWPFQMGSIIPTIYSKQVCESLMLDRLSQEDIERTIESLRLTSEGSIEKVLTEEDYIRHTNWQEFDNKGQFVIDPGILKREEEPYERDF